LCHNRTLSIVKAKCSRVVHKEVDEAVNNDVAQSCRGVIQVTFHDNVFLGLNLSFTTWAAGGEVEGESLSIFSDGGMSSSHVGETST